METKKRKDKEINKPNNFQYKSNKLKKYKLLYNYFLITYILCI